MRHLDRVVPGVVSGFRFVRCLMVIVVLAATVPAGAATLTIRVGYPQLNGGQTPLWNIRESRIDQKYGIDVHPV